MLSDHEMFDRIEKTLVKNGTVRRFEQENGKILGRMMIILTEIPDWIVLNDKTSNDLHAFLGTFDFYDCALGIVMSVKNKKAASSVWVTPQKDNAEVPAQEWVEFFIKKIIESIDEDGSFGTPVYSFVTDSSDMTIVPSKQ